jgi:hypothetical protein
MLHSLHLFHSLLLSSILIILSSFLGHFIFLVLSDFLLFLICYFIPYSYLYFTFPSSFYFSIYYFASSFLSSPLIFLVNFLFNHFLSSYFLSIFVCFLLPLLYFILSCYSPSSPLFFHSYTFASFLILPSHFHYVLEPFFLPPSNFFVCSQFLSPFKSFPIFRLFLCSSLPLVLIFTYFHSL